MKKLLLATTALAMSAGYAAADVTLSGDARMGLMYDGDDVMLTSRARVTFTLSGETDGGLAFGGSFRADNATGAAAGSAGSVFISGEFGKLSFGDVDGAALAATGDLYGVGLTGLGDRHEMQYVSRLVNGIDGTVGLVAGLPVSFPVGGGITANVTGVSSGLSAFPRALYTYTIDNFSVFASVGYSTSDEVTLNGNFSAGAIEVPASASFAADVSLMEAAIGAAYTFDAFTLAAGYENARLEVGGAGSFTAGHATLSAEYATDMVSVKAIVGKAMNDLEAVVPEDVQYGLGISTTFDATTVSAFARRDFFDVSHYGVGASYDLGGGASMVGGIAKSQGSDAVADFGLSFSF
jgi:outer membrane protein OmpU